jgi:microcystin-dependent protein
MKKLSMGIAAALATAALSLTAVPAMAATPPAYVGQIMIFAGNFCPSGWLATNGAVVPISSYQTLYELIGTTYGGDGASTFGLPKITVPKTARNGTLAPVKLSECIAYLGIFPSQN